MALGSNIGDRLAHLRRGVEALAPYVRIEAVSSVYQSEPVGYTQQPDFLNAVVTGMTELGARDLLSAAHAVEEEAGRERTFRGAPRTLDIDLLFHGTLVVRDPDLTVPHPRWARRSFVLAPLSEVAPALVDPASGRTVLEVWEACRNELPPVERVASLEDPWSRHC